MLSGARGSQRGATAVELAIVAPLLFLILFGIIQFGIAFNRSQGLQAAAREGGRLGALPDTTLGQILQRVRDSVSIVDGSAIALGCPADTGTLSQDAGCVSIARRSSSGSLTPLSGTATRACENQPGTTVVVSVAYRTAIAIPVWKDQPVTLEGQGEFACEA